jgi:hypothetical protein
MPASNLINSPTTSISHNNILKDSHRFNLVGWMLVNKLLNIVCGQCRGLELHSIFIDHFIEHLIIQWLHGIRSLMFMIGLEVNLDKPSKVKVMYCNKQSRRA